MNTTKTWSVPYPGVWHVAGIGGGGGSGAYNNSHAYASGEGFPGNTDTQVSYTSAGWPGTVTVGQGGAGGTIDFLTFNPGSSGTISRVGSSGVGGGGSGGSASTGVPIPSPTYTSPSLVANTTSYTSFMGQSSDGILGNNTGRGGSAVYGNMVSNLPGNPGNSGAVFFACIG